MIGFFGEQEATIDAKGRFLFPAAFRKQLPEGESRFFINRGLEKCLNLYTVKAWEEQISRISKLNDFNPKVRQFKLLFLGGATEVELDSAGRMLLPPSLRGYATLEKAIVLAGNIDKINIWDAKTYNQVFENNSQADYSDLANEVMGDLMNDVHQI